MSKTYSRALSAVIAGAVSVMLGATTVPASAMAGEATLATGSEVGTYHPVGVALRLLMADSPDGDAPKLTVIPTQGSVANLKGLHDGTYDFAIAQGDQVIDAYRGVGAFADKGPMPELRGVLSLHPESLALVVAPGAKIKSLDDLAGKRVDLGPKGSGARQLATALMATLAPSAVKPVEMRTGETNLALCDKRLDAAFVLVGHPSATLIDALTRCKTRLVPLDGPKVDALLASNGGLNHGVIPGKLYPRVAKPLPTIGVHALLVTTDKADPKAVTAVVKAAVGDFAVFRMMHPALFGIADVSELRPDGGAVPLHAAAETVFKAR